MRRYLAYIIMIVTVIAALLFNTQTVLESKTDALEYGSGIQLVYSIDKRDKTEYDATHYPDIASSGTEDLEDIDIETKIMDRLDDAGVRNADVSIVEGDDNEGYELRVSLSPLSDTELANVRTLLEIDGMFSIGTEGDDYVIYDTASEIFDGDDDDDRAEIIYNGTTPYPTLNFKDSETYDELKSKAEEAQTNHKNDTSEARRFNAEGDGTEEEQEATVVYLWYNKTVDDTYDKAFGTNGTIQMEEVHKKVIAEIDLANWDSNEDQLAIVNDMDGNEFTISEARAFVNALCAEDYGFDLNYLYQQTCSPTFGENGLQVTYIVSIIVLAVIAAVMILRYGFAGITGAVTMLSSTLVSFLLCSLLGFEFSIAAICGLIVTIALSIAISINYFERVKSELKKGRNVEKANKEGYTKSFFNALDLFIISLLVSVICFLIADGPFETFFGVIMVGTVFASLITNYLNRWMMFWLVKDTTNENLPYFSFFKQKEKEMKKVEFCSADKKHFTHKTNIIIPIVTAVAFAACLPIGYAISGKDKSFFNNSSDFASGYTLTIQYETETQAYDKLETIENFVKYIVKIGESEETQLGNKAYTAYDSDEAPSKLEDNEFVYYYDTASLNIVEKHDDEDNIYYVNYFFVNVDKDLNNVYKEAGYDVVTVITRAMSDDYDINIGDTASTRSSDVINPMAYSHYDDESLEVGSYMVKATNVGHTTFNIILLVFLISVFAFAYILVRFGVNIALSQLAVGTTLSALEIAVLSILRLPFSSYTGFALMTTVFLFNLLVVFALGKNREILKERGLKKNATNEERAEIANEVAKKSLLVTVPLFALAIVTGIFMLFINTACVGLGICLIAYSLIAFFGLYFFAVPLYYFFACHISFTKIFEWFKKRREANGNVDVAFKDGHVYVDQDGPHETIIPGMNDFLF